MSISSFQWICDTTGANTTNSVCSSVANIRTSNNEISFTGSINEANINSLIKTFDETIVALKSKNTSSLSVKDDKIEIILYIDSPGGYLKDTFKYIDYIKIIKRIHHVKLTTVGMGIIASAATLIHAIGDERYISVNTTVMIHELYTSVAGKYTEINSYIKQMQNIHEKLIKVYMDNNKKDITRERLEDLLKSESWFNSDEYIELGFADAIYE